MDIDSIEQFVARFPTNESQQIDLEQIIKFILPPKSTSYKTEHIGQRLAQLNDELVQVKRSASDRFDSILEHPDSSSIERLQNLHINLKRTQADIVKLECDISFAKEQFYLVNSLKNNPVIKELSRETFVDFQQAASIRRPRFQPLTDFFESYAPDTCEPKQ